MYGNLGNECGICFRQDQVSSNPQKFPALSSLVRALIRFSYDEWMYNGHWGGDEAPEELFSRENEIFKHSFTPDFPRSAQTSGEFLAALLHPPYPDYDKGIAIYAGNCDGERLPLLSAIRTSRSPIYERISKRLSKENYFLVEDEFADYLSKLTPAVRLPLQKGTLLFRARIGTQKRFGRVDKVWTAETMFQPFLGPDIGAPPLEKATDGRLNRSGVSFLYLATDEATAIAEIRPHPGHQVSIGAFSNKKKVVLADFSAIDILDFAQSDARLDIFHLGHTISREIALPVTPEDRHKYNVTQLLADIVRRQGFDGVRFPSSVAPGFSVCVFDPSLFEQVANRGRVLRIHGLSYQLEQQRFLIEPEIDDFPLP